MTQRGDRVAVPTLATRMAMAEATSLYYRLDDRDTIIGAGGGWDKAALEGDAPHLTADRVVGSNLFSHVAGTETALFLGTLLASVRRKGMPRRHTYRCDTPVLRRTFAMTIAADQRGCIVMTHDLQTSVASRRPIFVRDDHDAGAQGTCQRCSFCNRVSLSGVWTEADEGSHSAGMSQDQPQTVFHVVCEDCYRDVYGDRAGPTLLASHRTIATTRRSVAASLMISGRNF